MPVSERRLFLCNATDGMPVGAWTAELAVERLRPVLFVVPQVPIPVVIELGAHVPSLDCQMTAAAAL